MTDRELPAGWASSPLEDLLTPLDNGKLINHGWSPQCENQPAARGSWGVLKTTAIQPGRFQPEHNKALPDALDPRPGLEVKAGDMLLTCAGPRSRCGIPAYVRATPNNLILSGKMYRFRSNPALLNPRFLEFFLLSAQGQSQIESMKTGISDSGLNLTHGRFLKLQVPVAPLPEQERIADEVERRLSHVDAAERDLSVVVGKMSVAREVVIHAAITGTLSVLGDSLNGESPRVKMPTGGGESPAVPPHWKWVPLKEVLREPMRNGRSAQTAPDGKGVRVYTITAVTQRDWGLHNTKWAVGDAESLADLLVKDGDIFVQRSNTPQLVGSSALYRGPDDRATFPDLLIRLRPNGSVLPEWLEAVLMWSFTRKYMRAVASGLSGSMPKVDQNKVGNALVPVPPIAEQATLVTEMNRRLSILDASRRATEVGLRRCAQVRVAVLTAAFTGQLVAQDPSDVPATIELARVQAQPKANQAGRKSSSKQRNNEGEPE